MKHSEYNIFNKWALIVQNGENNISNTQIDKARYDRSYVVKISGVNRKFTGLSAEEKSQLIRQFNIPDKPAVGDGNFYTIRWNGALYVIQSGCSFSPGDSAVLKIPDNNMDNMRLEAMYVKSTHDPVVFFERFEPPTGDGYDFWITVGETNGNVQIEGFYGTYIDTENNIRWRSLNFETCPVGSPDMPEINTALAGQDDYYCVMLMPSEPYIDIRKCGHNAADGTYFWENENIWDVGEFIPLKAYTPFDVSDINSYPASVQQNNYISGSVNALRYIMAARAYLTCLRPPEDGDIWIETDERYSGLKNCNSCGISAYNSKSNKWVRTDDDPGAAIVSVEKSGNHKNGDFWVQRSRNSLGGSESAKRLYKYMNGEWVECNVYDGFDTSAPTYKIVCDDDTDEIRLIYYYGESYDIEGIVRDTGDIVYPVDETAIDDENKKHKLIETTVMPGTDGTLWLKLKGKKNRYVEYIDRFSNGEWRTAYKIKQGDKNPALTCAVKEPAMPSGSKEGDCWVTVDDDKLFTGLYIYGEEWDDIEDADGGSALPNVNTADEGDHFVIVGGEGEAVSVYICEAELSESSRKITKKWVPICPTDKNKLVTYKYPPLKDGDLWAEINDDKKRMLVALHRYKEADKQWKLLYCAGAAELPQFFVQEDEPVTEEEDENNPDEARVVVNEGDYWAKISEAEYDNRLLYSYWKYIRDPEQDEDTPEEEIQYTWSLLYTVHGVGENVGAYNERFNDYLGNIIINKTEITSGEYQPANRDYIIAHLDELDPDDYDWVGEHSHAEGARNVVIMSSFCYVGGGVNEIRNSLHSMVHGSENVLKDSLSSFVVGRKHDLKDDDCSVIAGNSNKGKYVNSVVAGRYNDTITGSYSELKEVPGIAQQSIVTGSNNKVNAWSSIVAGDYNFNSTVYNDYSLNRSILAGENNNVGPAESSLIVGRYHRVMLPGQTYCAVVCGVGAMLGQGMSSTYIIVGNSGNVFTVDSSGRVRASAYDTQGADYAEYFEWLDGNPDNTDRRGMLVSLTGDKIMLADGDDIFGIVSASPSVVGNAAELEWQGRRKRDIFGTLITEENGDPVFSENYDCTKEYIPRSKRPEWAAVGLVGRLVVVDDGSCVPDKYCIAKGGIASLSENKTNVRTLKRIDDTHIEIFIK